MCRYHSRQFLFHPWLLVHVPMTTESASTTSVCQYMQDVGGICMLLCVCVCVCVWVCVCVCVVCVCVCGCVCVWCVCVCVSVGCGTL